MPCGLKCFCVALLTVGLWGGAAALAFAQNEIKPSRIATPEIIQITPNSAPIGATSELTLTGKNFITGLYLGLVCSGTGVTADSVQVTSPEHATARITVPENAQEGVCQLAPASTHPVPFRLVASANSPILLKVHLVGEGECDAQKFYDMFSKQGGQGLNLHSEAENKGRDKVGTDRTGLRVDSTALKYVDSYGDAVFEESVSAVKSTAMMTGRAKMSIPGSSQTIQIPMQWFRITFSDGKIYNFADADKYETLKKKLGK
jgi:hypothetical protein